MKPSEKTSIPKWPVIVQAMPRTYAVTREAVDSVECLGASTLEDCHTHMDNVCLNTFVGILSRSKPFPIVSVEQILKTSQKSTTQYGEKDRSRCGSRSGLRGSGDAGSRFVTVLLHSLTDADDRVGVCLYLGTKVYVSRPAPPAGREEEGRAEAG